MTTVNVTLTLDGDKNLKQALAEIDMKAKNPVGFYKVFGAYMKTIPLRAMREQADPVTLQAWPDRSPISLLSRRGSGGKTLQDTTALLRSFNQAPVRIDDQGVSVGTDLKYAITHQLGMTLKPKKKYLTIPLEPKLRLIGIREWFKKKKGEGANPFFYHSKSGKVLAAYSKGKGKARKLSFAWLLKTSVTVPRRRFAGFGKRDKERCVQDARAFFSSKGAK